MENVTDNAQKKNRQDKTRQDNFSLPFPHKLASAPATILSVCGSTTFEAVFASSLAPPLLTIKP